MPKLCLFMCLAALLAGCGGGAGQPPFPIESAFDTATIADSINTSITTYTVHRDGTAQRVTRTCCPQASSSPTNKTLPPAVVAKLFADLAAAQPLNALPSGLNSDFALTISWNGDQTPNLKAGLPTPNATEQTLLNDADAIAAAFPR
jgi:hypothetical protein